MGEEVGELVGPNDIDGMDEGNLDGESMGFEVGGAANNVGLLLDFGVDGTMDLLHSSV